MGRALREDPLSSKCMRSPRSCSQSLSGPLLCIPVMDACLCVASLLFHFTLPQWLWHGDRVIDSSAFVLLQRDVTPPSGDFGPQRLPGCRWMCFFGERTASERLASLLFYRCCAGKVSQFLVNPCRAPKESLCSIWLFGSSRATRRTRQNSPLAPLCSVKDHPCVMFEISFLFKYLRCQTFSGILLYT